MVKRGLYPSALATIKRQLEPAVEASAKAFADQLRENVSAGSRSGVQYNSLPRRSSAPSEMPQEQGGDLKASVEANPTSDPLKWQAGFYGDDQAKLESLEYGSRNMAERAPLQRTAQDAETRKRMLEAAKGVRQRI